ncbi:MAG: tetratricopeptide repeat protein [Chloroflexia bacterium]
MAGNRGIYNAAMKRAQEHAQKQEWSAALKEYQRAAAEFPDDMDARLGIAAAYDGLQRWREAQEVYRKLQQEAPEDPVILERLAESYVQSQDLAQAREVLLRLSDLHVLHRKVPQAISVLERLSQLLPQDEEVLNRLASLYLRAGDRLNAVRIQTERVRLLFRQGRLDEAMALGEETLKLAPDNRQVKELLFRLRREVAARKERGEVPEAPPTGVVSTYQLEEWAREAAQRQEQGDLEGAVRLYERAVQGGLRRADALYSLGLLYKEAGRLQEAVGLLQEAAGDDEFALSSHYALGECYRDLGQLDQAAQEFERAIHLVDLQSIGREAVEDLIQMYEAAADVHERRKDLARAASLYATLAGFLQNKRWKQGRTDEFRRRAQELTERSMFEKLRQLGTGILPAIEGRAREPAEEVAVEEPPPIPPLTEGTLRPITDFLRAAGQPEGTFPAGPPAGTAVAVKPLEEALAIVPPVPVQLPVRALDTSGLEEPIQELVQASRIYLERGLFNAAIDVCCEVIAQAPDYLPIHLRLAEIYERQDRPEMALAKYQALARTYLARAEKEKAVEVYRAMLALSPDAVPTRSHLADLLLELGRTEEAVQEKVQLAQSYFRLGQTNRAIETFREVRALAPEDKEVYLEYGLFLLKMDRPEAALGELRRALQLDPQDIRALARVNMALAWLGEEKAFWESLGSVLRRAEQDAEAARIAEKEYRDALLLQESPLLYYVLGLLKRQAGLLTEALEHFQRAYRHFGPTPSDPLQLRLCRALAEAYLLLSRPEEAIRILEQGLEWAGVLAPPEPTPGLPDFAAIPTRLTFYHWLAEAYTRAGRLDQAVAALNQAKGSHPFDRETCTKLADLYFRQGNLKQALAELSELAQHYEQGKQLDRALEIYQNMARLAPNNIAVRKYLSRLYIRRGFVDQGLEELETVTGLQQKRGLIEEAVASLQEMADIYWTMGRHDRAYQVYDRIVHLAPNDVAARQQLVNLHILAGRLADALEEQRNIARIALQRKDAETSIAALHQVLALDPQDRWALRELADLLASRGEHGQALRLYRRLARLEPNNAEVARRIQEEEALTGSQADASG